MVNLKKYVGVCNSKKKMSELIAMRCRSRFKEIRRIYGIELVESLLSYMGLWTVWMFGLLSSLICFSE